MKAEFTQIAAPGIRIWWINLIPANAIEDFAEGVYKDLPYSALAAAVFFHVRAKKVDIIPDISEAGRADDSVSCARF